MKSDKLFEVTKSSWEQYEPSTWKCNNCQTVGKGSKAPNFCPNCGRSEEKFSEN
jgi:rubrerythrin